MCSPGSTGSQLSACLASDAVLLDARARRRFGSSAGRPGHFRCSSVHFASAIFPGALLALRSSDMREKTRRYSS
jgi:hypothetical protein